MTFYLDVAPAYGQRQKMLFRADWNQQTPFSGRTLAEVAEECFAQHRTFFVVLAQLDNVKSSVIPTDVFCDHMDEYSFCRSTLLFSCSQEKKIFTFELTLDKGEEGARQISVIEGIYSNQLIEPHQLVIFLDTLPPSIRLLNRVSRYALKQYSPLLSSWPSLITKINEYAQSVPYDAASMRSSTALLTALSDNSSPRKIRHLRVLKTVKGAAVYVYYSLIGYWRRSRTIEQRLERSFQRGSRNPTLLYAMAHILSERDVEGAWKVHRLYRHRSESLNISNRVNKSIQNVLLEKDMLSRLEKDPTPEEEAEYWYALSLIYETVGKQQESREARQHARAISLAGMRREPDNPSYLQVYGGILKRSPLRQEQDVGQEFIRRSLAEVDG